MEGVDDGGGVKVRILGFSTYISITVHRRNIFSGNKIKFTKLSTTLLKGLNLRNKII